MEILLAATPQVAWYTTLFFALILVGLIACLALEEQLHAKKSVIAGSFAVVCLLLGTFAGVLNFEEVVVGSYFVKPPKTDLEIEYIKDGQKEPEKLLIHAEPETSDADNEKSSDEDVDQESNAAKTHHESHPLHVEGHEISMPVYIPGVDWGVIAIILGSSLFVDVTSKSGLFTWIAIRVTKASRGDPRRLLFFYGIMTVIFSAVLNNVTAMIIVGSLTVVSLEKLDRRHQLLPFLLIEGLLTNIGGLLTLISSVPNIIVGTTADISFLTFFIKAAPYVFVATLVTLAMGSKIYNIRKLTDVDEKKLAADKVASFDETDGVESWGFFRLSSIMLLLFIITIATTSALPGISKLGMGFVALSFASLMLWRFKSDVNRFYSAIDWDLLGFFVALFVVIYVMEHANVLGTIGAGISYVLTDIKSEVAGTMDATLLTLGSAFFSSVTDNIPLSAMLANILKSLDAPNTSGLWWSVIFGSNLGGNLTPIGSASTLVAVTIMHKHELKMSFFDFVKAAFPFAVVQILIALLYVLFVVPHL